MTTPAYFARGCDIMPAAQVLRPVGIYHVATTALGYHFRVDCLGWALLSYQEKIARVSAFRPWNPAGGVRAVDVYCARISRGLRPAGQASGSADMTFTPNEVSALDGTGGTYDSNGNPIGSSALGLTSFGTPGASTGSSMSPQQETALFNTIGGALSTTGATIASIVQSNNQVQIAQLQTQTQQEIASLTAQSQQAAAAGNLALAQQRAQQAQQLQAFNAQYLMSHPASNTTLYVVAGVIGLGIIGGIVYMLTRK